MDEVEREKQQFWAMGDDEFEDEEYEDEETDEEGEDEEEEYYLSFACEDCDYRWEIVFDEESEDIEEIPYCPMCGSSNVTQI
ncbi:MAG: hypothetical protein NZM25_10600 [Leptospiraceae bacterium]|nr:hypothetical protein [Leptospiraceae bacterium]MDW8305877.1 hypothetical protein [Leptospiraceae bacterium]